MLAQKMRLRWKWWLVGIAVLVVLAVVARLYLGQKGTQGELVEVINDYPVWMLKDGDVAVARQTELYEDSIKKRIVVKKVDGEVGGTVKIVESIPKEMAWSASLLEFNVEPTIIDDDPLVMWELNLDEFEEDEIVLTMDTGHNPVKEGAFAKKQKQDSVFLEMFTGNWPTLSQSDPVKVWQDYANFSQDAMNKSANQAMTSKFITMTKDVADIAVIMATGTGILDAANLMGEIYSLGTALYGEDTSLAYDNANYWMTLESIAQAGYENRNLLRAAKDAGVAGIKAKHGVKVATTVSNLGKGSLDALATPGARSAAASAGLNIAGIIIDYAVINAVADTTKYHLFEMDQQGKMVVSSKKVLELWEKYVRGDLAESEAKQLMELEILFNIAQQDELRVRKEYLKTQLGLLDTVFSYVPIAGQYSARSGIEAINETMRLAQNELNWRLGARAAVYGQTEVTMERLREAEQKALQRAEQEQNKQEEISEVINFGDEKWDKFGTRVGERIFFNPPKTTSTPTKRLTPTPTPTPTPIKTKKKTVRVDKSIFPDTLQDLPNDFEYSEVNEGSCWAKNTPKFFHKVFYCVAAGRICINMTVAQYSSSQEAHEVAVDCGEKNQDWIFGLYPKSMVHYRKEADILGFPVWHTFFKDEGETKYVAVTSVIENVVVDAGRPAAMPAYDVGQFRDAVEFFLLRLQKRAE